MMDHIDDDIGSYVLNFLYPFEIIQYASTCKSILNSIKTVWMSKMSCFQADGSLHHNVRVSARNNHNHDQDLFVERYPFNQLDVSVLFGTSDWRHLRFYHQYMKHIVQDLRFDQVVGSMSHHPNQPNTIVPNSLDYTKGLGVSNRIMRAGIFRVTFFSQDVLCRGKKFGITRPDDYAGSSHWEKQGPDITSWVHAYESLQLFYQDPVGTNVAMISDFRRNGLHSTTLKGRFSVTRQKIENTAEFSLGSRQNGSIISLELRLKPDGTEGALILIIPDGDNITIARNLSGEYVWFAQAENPKDHCDITIIDG